MRRSPTGRGNVWVGRRRDLFTLAHASKTSVVTVERVTDDNLLLDDTLARRRSRPSILARSLWRRAAPGRCGSIIRRTRRICATNLALAATEDGFRRYLDRYVHGRRAA